MKTENIRYFLFGLLIALAFVFLIGADGDNNSENQPGKYQVAMVSTPSQQYSYKAVILDTQTGIAKVFTRISSTVFQRATSMNYETHEHKSVQ